MDGLAYLLTGAMSQSILDLGNGIKGGSPSIRIRLNVPFKTNDELYVLRLACPARHAISRYKNYLFVGRYVSPGKL